MTPTTDMTKDEVLVRAAELLLDGAQERYEQLKADYIEKVQDNPSYAAQWHLAGLIEAQTRAEIANRIFNPKSEGVTTIELITAFMTDAERRIGLLRAASKSTSQAANLVEDIEIATLLRLYAELRDAREWEV